MTDNKVIPMNPTSAESLSLAMTQKSLMVEQARFEQDLAKTDRLMKGRSMAFSLAVESMKAGAFKGDVDALIKEAGKIELFLSVGADKYQEIADKLNCLDEEQDAFIIEAASKP